MMQNHRIIPIRLDPVSANITSLSTLSLSSILFWQTASRMEGYAAFEYYHILFFLVGLPLLIAIHESTHALAGMVFGKLPLKAFEFGIIWRGLMPYCHCKEPVTVRVYRLGALMPLVITVPLFVGLLFLNPAGWVALLTAFSLSGCVGDILICRKLNTMKANDLVVDCPDEAGCDVIVNEEAPPA